MAVYFVSRHPGAIAWMKRQNIRVDAWFDHLTAESVNEGDTVIGVLPIHLVARLCQKNVKFYALTMECSRQQRGQELNDEQLNQMSCHLTRFDVRLVEEMQ